MTKSLKKKLVLSVFSAAASVLVSYAAAKIRHQMMSKLDHKQKDKALDKAIIGSMDCSDPVAKY